MRGPRSRPPFFGACFSVAAIAESASLAPMIPSPTSPPTNATERLLFNVPFRLLVAGIFIAYHVVAVSSFARARFDLPINSEPNSPPTSADASSGEVAHAHRLIFSRWDSGHYISIAAGGYAACPKVAHIDRPTFERYAQACRLGWYPGYPLLGRIVMAITRLPADYALWVVSLLASFFFLFLWTDPAVQRRLGPKETYLALLLFNAFPAASNLVFIMSEPATLFFTLAAFVALLRKHVWLAALAAGAAGAMRLGGLAAGLACAATIAFEMWQERGRGRAFLVGRAACIPLTVWGTVALVGYDWWRFDDAHTYVEAQDIVFHRVGTLKNVLFPKLDWILRSIDSPTHDLVWAIGILFWFLLGHRLAFKRFAAHEQFFCYALALFALGMGYAGSIELNLLFFNRYALVAIPVFYAMAAFLRSRPAVLAVWLAVCVWHYFEVDTCFFVGGVGRQTFEKCHMR